MVSFPGAFRLIMKKTAAAKNLFASILIGIAFIGYFFSAFEIRKKAIARSDFGPDFFPMLIAGTTVFLCVLISFFEAVKLVKRTPAAERKAADEASKPRTKIVLFTLLLIVAYIALLDVLGFIIATALYLTLQIGILSPIKPTKRTVLISAGASLVFAALIFHVFTEFFLLLLPAGFLG